MTLTARQRAFKLTDRLENPLDLYQHLPFRIAVISNLLLLSRDSDIRSLSALGPRELRVLLNVGSYMPVTSADIAYQTRVDSYTISRAVSVLNKEGYLAFEESPTNRRVKLLALTEKGIELYQQICQKMDARSDAFAQVLSEAEVQELERLLTLVEDRAEKLLADNALDLQEREGNLSADQKELIRWRKKSCKP